MAISRIIRSLFCAMPVLVRSVTRSEGKLAGSRESLRRPHPGRCPCLRQRQDRSRLRPWVSMPSSSIGTMAMSWGFIPGSSCGIGVRARSARRREASSSAKLSAMAWERVHQRLSGERLTHRCRPSSARNPSCRILVGAVCLFSPNSTRSSVRRWKLPMGRCSSWRAREAGRRASSLTESPT